VGLRERLGLGSWIMVAIALLAGTVSCSSGNRTTAPAASPSSSSEAANTAAKPVLPPGLPPVTVPQVAGTTFRAANLTLGRVNLGIDVKLVASDTVSPGLVVSQEPAAGRTAAAFSTVTVAISSGPAQPLAAPNCQPSDLRLDLGEPVSEATGQHTADLVLTNISRANCNLYGYPTVALLDNKGKVLPFTYSHQGDQMTTAAQPLVVSLRTGWAAYVRINKYRCDITADDTTATLRLTLPGNHSPSLGLTYQGVSLDYCVEAPSLVVVVSPFESTALTVGPH
jgi:hypothetical protein